MGVYTGVMRKLLAMLCLVGLSACGVAEQVEQFVDSPATTVDTRIVGGWFAYPDEDDESVLCYGLISPDPIPCAHILNVFIQNDDGSWSAKWSPEVYQVGPDSPTIEDVCRTVIPDEWDFYGYTPEECAPYVS